MTHERLFSWPHVKWKGEMPVFGKMLFALLLMLPLVLFGMVTGVLQFILGWRRAPWLVISLTALSCARFSLIFYTIATGVAPTTAEFTSACTGGKNQKAACSTALDSLTGLHLMLVLLNVAMFVFPIAKYRSNIDHASKTD